ncbi:MAG: BamA/TamA family outer membrane protein [Tannerellaceae bacterium]|jgi:hypothetical protein|nr:BamA/TamA family outer membrane protein [Tannerellaceae bacterium]
MKPAYRISLLASLAILLLSACQTVKRIPDGSYLLNRTTISVDNKAVKTAELQRFIRQKPNHSPLRIHLYNAGDTTGWLKKIVRKLGEAPVLFNSKSVDRSVRELQTEMQNKGYLNAAVTARIDTAGYKKLNVHYIITSNEPYRIGNYRIGISCQQAAALLQTPRAKQRSGIREGLIFDAARLEEERQNINRLFHNAGYYGLDSDNLYFLADTTHRSNRADLTLALRDSSKFRPYTLRKVNVLTDYDPVNDRRFVPKDSAVFRDLKIFYSETHFIRPHVLYDNISVRPGQRYSEALSEETTNLLNTLSAVSKAGIEYREDSTTALLDCYVYLTPGNIHGLQASIVGTNNAGDLGVAGNIDYTHNNIFNGSEMLTVRLKGAYEFISGGSAADLLTHNYYELGVATGLTFPKIIFPFIGHRIKRLFKAHTEFGLSMDIQRRPEYTRDFFNLSWKYRWETQRGRLQHNLSVLAVNFVSMPYKSDVFKDYINAESNYLTKVSYDDLFTAGTGYDGLYTNAGRARYLARLYSLRYGIELSGNLLSAVYRLAGAQKNDRGQYELWGNPFAQYVKLNFAASQTHRQSERSAIALHGEAGIACPYGNSSIVPFEKRYYGGGPNSVRGWNTRQLGPGTYHANNDFGTQTGDVKIFLNAEYRYRLFPLLEVAAFVDAGNVWTIRNYPNQPGGHFRWRSFYREMALAAGIGLRLDLSFFVVRLDAGKKLYDPAQDAERRWVALEPFAGNAALHFAIGYPF